MQTYDPHATLLLATHNPAKFAEMKQLLSGLPCTILSLTDLGITFDVEETAQTFKENAALKAQAYAGLSGLVTIADDSGLVVDALHGEPGVYTNRYAGECASDEEKCQFLLRKLKNVPLEKRQAHFAVVVAIAYPDGKINFHEGTLHGRIALESRGKPIPKFPYRRVFELPEYGKTLAELQEQGVALESISPRQEVMAKVKNELLTYF